MLASSSSSSSPHSPKRVLRREMRPGFALNQPDSPAPMATEEAIPPAAHAVWRSPVPYLFGGLAAMLSLITFALLILACSYWKLSGYLERVGGAGHMSETANSGDGGGEAVDGRQEKPATALEERIVVIMAGDDRRLFLANPIRSRASILTGDGGDRESSAAAAKVREAESDGCREMVKPDDAVNGLGGDGTQSHLNF